MRINNIEITFIDNNYSFWSRVKEYCSTPENIEGFDVLWNAQLNGEVFHRKYSTHHKLEIDENKTKQELIKEGRYFNRPASELVFLTCGQHTRLHNKNRPGTWLGKKRSEETKMKIRMSNNTPEAKLKNSLAHIGKKKSEETKRRMSIAKRKNSKPVSQYTKDGVFIRTWECMTDVEKELNIDHHCIKKCCDGKLNTSGGYKWKYEV